MLFDSPPLNSAGPVIKWIDEWAISACQLLAWPGELGRCQAESRTNTHTHIHKGYQKHFNSAL